jgi:hypothetical protein
MEALAAAVRARVYDGSAPPAVRERHFGEGLAMVSPFFLGGLSFSPCEEALISRNCPSLDCDRIPSSRSAWHFSELPRWLQCTSVRCNAVFQCLGRLKCKTTHRAFKRKVAHTRMDETKRNRSVVRVPVV